MKEPPPLEVVIHILYGKQRNDICRFCYKEDDGKFLSIYDFFTIRSDYFRGTTSIENILRNLLHEDILFGFRNDLDLLPHIVCNTCSREIMSFFLFKEKFRVKEKYWENALSIVSGRIKHLKASAEGIKIDDECFSDLDQLEDDDNEVVPEKITYKPVRSKVGIKRCTACPKKFKSTRELNRHWTKFHPKLPPGCKECGKVYTTAYSLKIHEETHKRGRNIYECSKCDKTFSIRRILREHMKNDHGEKTIQCAECPMKFTTNTMLSRHRYRKHKEKKPVNCSECNESFSTTYLLHKHLAKDHDFKLNGEKSNPMCDICGKILCNQFTLKCHKISCERKSDSKYGDGRNRHVCSLCGTIFNTKNNLQKHMSAVHIMKKIPCEVCGKLFKTKAHLRNHAVVHTRERPYRCDQCSKCFVSRTALLCHTRLHSGEKPYPCQLCDERFLSSSRRMQHMRRKHLGPKYQCEICNNCYHIPYDLKRHQRKHLNPKSKLKTVAKPIQT